MEKIDKIKIIFEIVKSKIIFFTGVIAGSSYMILNFESFTTAFGKLTTLGIVVLLYNYGVIGILSNILKITKLQRGLENELE